MAAMPLLCIIQGTACLCSKEKTSSRINQRCQLHLPLSLSALGLDAGCVHLGLLGCFQTLWGGSPPWLAPRAVTGIKQRKGWVEGLIKSQLG